MSNPGAPRSHKAMVLAVAQHLKQRNYRDLHAAAEGYPAPVPVGNGKPPVSPDVTVVNRKDSFHLFEVETANGLSGKQGSSKWTLLANFASANNAVFWLVVPKGARSKAEKRLADLNLTARIWEI